MYCDVEVTEDLQKEAYEEFKRRYVRQLENKHNNDLQRM
jgi:hypothetical protein